MGVWVGWIRLYRQDERIMGEGERPHTELYQLPLYLPPLLNTRAQAHHINAHTT